MQLGAAIVVGKQIRDAQLEGMMAAVTSCAVVLIDVCFLVQVEGEASTLVIYD